MKHTKEYFQHDYNARNSLQLQAMMCECGSDSYGIFWAIVEVLHEKKNKVPLKAYIFSGIADQIKTNPEKVEKVIRFCIEQLEIFREKNGVFYSTRVKANIIKRLQVSKVRAKAGKRGANAKQKLAKESKVKESKVNKGNKEWDSIKENFFNDFNWQEKFCKQKEIGPHALIDKMHEFISDIELKEDYKDLKELKKHFTNLFNKNGHQSNGKLGTSETRVAAVKNF